MGIVTKRGISSRYGFLFDDILVITKAKKKEYKVYDVISLSEVTVRDLPDEFKGKKWNNIEKKVKENSRKILVLLKIIIK